MEIVDFSVQEDYTLLRNYIEEISGISIPVEKAYLIETRLTKLMLDYGVDTFADFYTKIKQHPNATLQQKIINSITTNETFWFRDELPWKVLEIVYLPRYIQEIRSGLRKKVRIWSCAASTGQEIYSTVMCVMKYLHHHKITDVTISDFDFFATDISSRVLETAKKGRYDSISMSRGLTDEYRTLFFHESDLAWEIDESIKEVVRFGQYNLKNNFQIFGQFDIIFCRYVMIYFTDSFKKELVNKLYQSLIYDGVLFTGNYVLYEMMSARFELNHYQNLTYYTPKI